MHSRTMAVIAAVATMAAIQPAHAAADLDLVVNALPATVLLDASGDKFAVEGPDGRVSLSEVYTMPNIAVGVGMPIGDAYIDLLGGGGVLINDGFRSYMLQLLLEANWSVTDALDIGPRVGLVYWLDPEWLENDDVSFDSDAGFLFGLGMAMGDKIKYIVSVDLIDTSLDVTSKAGVTASDDQFDMLALAIQFGVRGEF